MPLSRAWSENCVPQGLKPRVGGDAFGTAEAVPLSGAWSENRVGVEGRAPAGYGEGDEGFLLAAVIVLVFLMLLTLSIAAPQIGMSIKRDRELEAQHRANQYVRAIRVYSIKFKGQYPGSIEQLQKSNNQRFLRQKYLDPLTGKDDWRLIHVGENKTKVKGFFGEDLPGLSGGLNAGGLTSSGSGLTTGNSTTSGTAASVNGSSGTNGTTSGVGATGTGIGAGISSQSTDSLKGTGGPIKGVGSSATGEAILTVNEQTNYQDWEFLYDPRIEQLYAKGNLMGGGITSGSPSGNGLNTTPISGTVPPTPVTPPTQATPQP